jgi:hypothetical protein
MDKFRWKFGFVLSLCVALLVGFGFVLLRTHQAPILLEKEVVQDQVESIAAAPSAPSVAEEKPLSQEEFRLLGAEVMKALPMAGTEGELSIVSAAEKFAPIQQAIRNEPTLAEEGMLLYLECGKSAQIPVATRALCVAYLERHSGTIGKRLNLEKIPRRVTDLAKTLQE